MLTRTTGLHSLQSDGAALRTLSPHMRSSFAISFEQFSSGPAASTCVHAPDSSTQDRVRRRRTSLAFFLLIVYGVDGLGKAWGWFAGIQMLFNRPTCASRSRFLNRTARTNCVHLREPRLQVKQLETHYSTSHHGAIALKHQVYYGTIT